MNLRFMVNLVNVWIFSIYNSKLKSKGNSIESYKKTKRSITEVNDSLLYGMKQVLITSLSFLKPVIHKEQESACQGTAD